MTRLDVTAVGNALVDVIARAEDAFLASQNIIKASYDMIDENQAHALYGIMGPGQEVSGGSAANTVACIASLGGTSGFIGRVRNDQLGDVFAHDIRAQGVEFTTEAATAGPSTGRCMVLVSPDGERSMRTYLGIAPEITAADIDGTLIARSQVFYIEGYLWNAPETKQSLVMGIQVAHRTGNRAALTLSDTFCVNMYRDEFNELIDNHIDILFANEHEIMALTQASSFDAAVAAMRGRCEIMALTRSEKGAVILAGDDSFSAAAEPVEKVIDATGAGDAYAAGFLAGLTQGRALDICGRMGAIAAAEVISHIGARPLVELAGLVKARLE